MISKRWDKQRIVWMWVILGLELFVCLYFMFFIGKVKAAKEVRLTTARQELDTVRNDAGQLSDMQKQLREAMATVSHLEPGTAPEKMGTYFPTMLSQLQTLAVAHHLKLEVVMPGQSKAVNNPPPPPAAAPAGAAPVTGSNAPAPGAAPVAPAPEMQEVTSSMTLTGTFQNLMAFVESLKKFPKVIKIDSMQLRPKDMDTAGGVSPELGVTMQITGTILPFTPEVDNESQANSPK